MARLSKVGDKAAGDTKPRGLGRGARVGRLQRGWLPQRNKSAAERQLQKKIMAVLEVCAAQGTGWVRPELNLVRGKRVPGAPWRRRKCEGSAARLVGCCAGERIRHSRRVFIEGLYDAFGKGSHRVLHIPTLFRNLHSFFLHTHAVTRWKFERNVVPSLCI